MAFQFFKKAFSEKSHIIEATKPASCPYCGIELEKIPIRKTKCKSCNKYYYAKRRPGEEEKRIVTDQEKEAIEREWDEHQFIKKWKPMVGFNDENLSKTAKMMGSKTGVKPSNSEIIWELFLEKEKKTRDSQDLKMLHFKMALFLFEEGKNYEEYLRISHKVDLDRFMDDDYINDVIVHPCELCKGKIKIRMPKKEALEKQILPRCGVHEEGWCMCMYSWEHRR